MPTGSQVPAHRSPQILCVLIPPIDDT